MVALELLSQAKKLLKEKNMRLWMILTDISPIKCDTIENKKMTSALIKRKKIIFTGTLNQGEFLNYLSKTKPVFMPKPYTPKEILETLKQLFKLNQKLH